MERTGIHELTAAYALDALDERDERAYEEHLARCERCRADLADLQGAAAAMAFAVEDRAPAPALRERILTQARAERSNVVPLRRWRAATFASVAVAAAAALAAVGLAVLGTSLSAELDEERAASAILADPDARTIALEGAQGNLVVAPDGRAALVVDLDEAPDGRAYEAWVIADGAPVPAGLFSGRDEHDVVELEHPVPDGSVVAVTLEDEDGAAAPSGDPLFSASA
jgi:anti-sigma-K factor RskA